MDQQPPQPNFDDAQPASSLQPVDQLSPPMPTSKKPKRRPIAILLAIALLVGGAGLYATLRHNSDTTASAKSGLTLYYSDGKTVLWQTGMTQTGVANGFVSLVHSELTSRYGAALNKGSWQVTTSLNRAMQQAAEAKLAAQQSSLSASRLTNSGVMATAAKTGQIVSWASQASNSSDLLTQKLPVGSLVLPLTYAAVIQKVPSTTAATTYADVQMPFPGYSCTNKAVEFGNCLNNYDRTYLGTVTLRQALGGLRLVPTAAAAFNAGLIDSYSRAATDVQFDNSLLDQGSDAFACYKVGSPALAKSDEAPCYASALFGDTLLATPQAMLAAYTTLANNGQRLPQTGISQVRHDGKVTYTWQQPNAERVMSANAAQIVTATLADQTASIVQPKSAFTVNGKSVSIASGITDNGESESTVSYNADYVAGAWAVGSGAAISLTNANQLTLPLAESPLQAAQ